MTKSSVLDSVFCQCSATALLSFSLRVSNACKANRISQSRCIVNTEGKKSTYVCKFLQWNLGACQHAVFFLSRPLQVWIVQRLHVLVHVLVLRAELKLSNRGLSVCCLRSITQHHDYLAHFSVPVVLRANHVVQTLKLVGH